MGHQQQDWSHAEKVSQGSCSCLVCSNQQGLIWKYGLSMCCQGFREHTKDIGFIKLD
ncbi:40S ribosomal protein S29-like [Molossus molossus]|uniref:40S ribosomal protein S29-like n=1 Tax=Molossus molossus TaxID=27622 RepID=UPI001745FF4A|nr:40S ribosomal protein S29-like [Molossus molossus]